MTIVHVRHAFLDALVRISWLAAEVETLDELDIDPLALTASGSAVVLDALVKVAPPAQPDEEHRAC